MDMLQNLGAALHSLQRQPRSTPQALNSVIDCLRAVEAQAAAGAFSASDWAQARLLLAQISGHLSGRLIAARLLRDAIKAQVRRQKGLVETYDANGLRCA
jgi:hypothetical protein